MSRIPRNITDHPRSRGEYTKGTDTVADAVGSSPLSRGILSVVSHMTQTIRIIPALAGNTDVTTDWDYRIQDHPRSRGEYPTYGTIMKS